VEEAKALGTIAFAKHPIFACLHYCTVRLRSGLLAAACAEAVCERRGHKAGYDKDKCNDHQQEEYQSRPADSTHCRMIDKSNYYSFLSPMIFKVLPP
jgi:hypothetical protein